MLEIAMNQINVTDIDKAIEWYTTKLGFMLSTEHNFHPRSVDLIQKNNVRLILYKVDKEAKIDYPHVTQSVIIFKTDNIVVACKDLEEKGVELVYPKPQQFPAGFFNAFRDPFGNVHEIVEFSKSHQ